MTHERKYKSLRFLFIRSSAPKDHLRASLAPGNIETMTAPVTVILAYDLKLYDSPAVSTMVRVPGPIDLWGTPRLSA